MALVSGRFKLDPRGAEPARPPVAPPVPAPRAIAPPPAPRPAPVPAATPAARAPLWRNRRVLLIAALVLAVLVVGGAIAFVATALGYPDKYVLERSEMPSGMSNARLTRSELDDAGMESNPGPMDPAALEDNFGGDSSDVEKAHGQILSTSDGGRIAILALKYVDEDAARSAAAEARMLCSFANGAALRDGDVLVVLFPEGASRAAVREAASALREKTGDLAPVCGL